MDDDLIKPAPVQNVPNTSPAVEEREDEATNVQMFDITADLNISPAKDDVENPAPISPQTISAISTASINTARPIKTEIPKPIPINIPISTPKVDLKKTTLEEAVSKITIPGTNPPTPVRPELTPKPQATTSQYGPANPPAKTIGSTTFSFKPVDQTKNIPARPTSLQEAVSSISQSNEGKTIPSKPVEIKNGPNVKPIRTYETDFAEAMSKRNLSKASFAIAEDKKEEAIKNEVVRNETIKEDDIISNENIAIADRVRMVEQKEPSHLIKNLILSILSLILVGGGAYTAYYFYSKSQLSLVTPPVPVAQPQYSRSIIKSDSQSIINIDNLTQDQIISRIKKEIDKTQKENSIKEILLTKTLNDITEKTSAKKILEIARLTPPDIFSRSLGTDWMLGVYASTNGQKNTFVITTNNFFQNTFAGIIQWEKTMPEDLGQYLYPTFPNNASSSELSKITLRGQYKDRIIKNKDVREYIAENGHIIFLYSFIDNNKLVITDSEETLQEIISRLEKTTLIR
ncbi:MAG: hypothetical protein WCS89_02860 [Candidatus Paceibacterota bacterium]